MYTHTGTDTLGLGIFYIGKETYSMIKHIVLYTLKSDVNKDEAVEITKNALEPLVGVIPGLRHLEIRPAYQGGMDFALYSEFESKEALRDYANHRRIWRLKVTFGLSWNPVIAQTMNFEERVE